MSCAIAVANSPVFSPSRVSSLFSKTSISSPETLNLTLNHHVLSAEASPSSSSSSSFRLRLQKSQSFYRASKLENCGMVESGSSSTISERKRPARIDIPSVNMDFTSPKHTSTAGLREVEVERDGFSVYCKKGRREAMEDRYSAVVDLQGDPKQAFFGVFDGHGGAKASEFAAKNMDKNIMDELTKRGEDDIEEAIKHGYLMTDTEFLKEDVSGGTCSLTAFIRKGVLVVSNAGDSRAVMSRGGISEALTSDHRPSREDEKDRIETLGGYVDFCHGAWRLQGTLAVSRGIGDGHLKQWVIAEPETQVLRIDPECEFLILASDGLWDKVSNQEAVDIARPLCVGIERPDPLSACKKLASLSVTRGSRDDISVMIIELRNFI